VFLCFPQAEELEDTGFDLSGFRQRQKTSTSFDSNSITPGTAFMERLSKALRYYVLNRVSTDPGMCRGRATRQDWSASGHAQLTRATLRHSLAQYLRHFLGRQHSRRGRAQNHGLYSPAAGREGLQPQSSVCGAHFWALSQLAAII
jgi:hypothetical protein